MRRSETIVRLAQRFPRPFRILLRLSRERVFPFRIYDHWLSRKIADALHVSPYHELWIRTVMYKECFKLVAALDPSSLEAHEISPDPNRIWSQCGFKSIQYVDYSDFDICRDRLVRAFDPIIADQALEHLLSPYRAARNAYQVLNPEVIPSSPHPSLSASMRAAI
jgi:hypothetical protein